MNDKYGFGLCIKRFAEYPEEEPIYGIVPHGAGLYSTQANKAIAPKQELLQHIPCIFSSSDQCFNAFWNSGKRNIFPIGLASIYAYELAKEDRITPNGSLFFRTHSVDAVQEEMDDEEVIRWLKSLPKEFQPIHTSAYPLDYRKGTYKIYEENGSDS